MQTTLARKADGRFITRARLGEIDRLEKRARIRDSRDVSATIVNRESPTCPRTCAPARRAFAVHSRAVITASGDFCAVSSRTVAYAANFVMAERITNEILPPAPAFRVINIGSQALNLPNEAG